ncbi:hypothetical protein WJX77_000405 [Trebouxia sp. C0004]
MRLAAHASPGVLPQQHKNRRTSIALSKFRSRAWRFEPPAEGLRHQHAITGRPASILPRCADLLLTFEPRGCVVWAGLLT